VTLEEYIAEMNIEKGIHREMHGDGERQLQDHQDEKGINGKGNRAFSGQRSSENAEGSDN